MITGSGYTTQKLYVARIEAFLDNCVARDTRNNAPIACKPQGTPPLSETTRDLIASFYPMVGDLTMRLAMGVGHIDQRQSEL